MKPSFQPYAEQATPECCFLSLCHKQPQIIIQKKNNHGLISNSHQIVSSNKNNTNGSQLMHNHSQSQLKRSISALKIKKRGQNMDSLNIKHEKPSHLKKNKFIGTSMDAEIFQTNYFKDKLFYFNEEQSQKIKENGHAQYYISKQTNSINFKKQKNLNQKIISMPKNQFFSPRQFGEKKFFLSPQKKQQIIPYNKKQQLKQQIISQISIFKNKQNFTQAIQQKRQSIQKIQEDLRQSKASDKKSLKIQIPKSSMKLQQVNSFIEYNKSNNNQKYNNQLQFDSIKTKGKPVQSMLYVSSNLRKTKKRENFYQGVNNMQNLQNRTVYSQYQSQDGDTYKKQKIQQSAVLVNFFHPPNHVKQRLNLSKRNIL